MLEVILNIFRGLLTPVIAAVVAYIAYQQHKTNRDKLLFTLYDKRLKVFEGFMELFLAIIQNEQVSNEVWNKYRLATSEAAFLFDQDLSGFKKTVDSKALDLLFIGDRLKKFIAGREREVDTKKKKKLLEWFTKELVGIHSKFGKYLKFEHKLEGKAVNWKEGFWRIAFVLTVVGGVVGIIGGILIVGALSESATLPIWVLIGLFILGSLGGAALGSLVVWRIYQLLEWLVLGFVKEKPKDEQKR